MAYDHALAERIRAAMAEQSATEEKRMFGGIAFMLRGHMFAGVLESTLMARVGPEQYDAALAKAHVREMDFTGKPMRGYVFVDPPGIRTDRQLQYWLGKCAAFVATLPKKAKK